jgi:hypothetical protein
MDTMVLTGYDDNMAEVGYLTSGLMSEYARRQGFEFYRIREYHKLMHASFQKVESVIHFLVSGFSHVIWIDADTLVTNLDFSPISDCKPGLNVSRDWGNVNPGAKHDSHFSMGNFVATPEAIPLFKYALNQTQWHWVDPGLEQAAIQEGHDNHQWIRDLVTVHNRRWSNSVDAGLVDIIDPKTNRPFHEDNPVHEPWEPGDWLLHLTGRPKWARAQNLENFFKTGKP